MVINATFNNISAISRRSVLLVEKTDVPGENHRPATSHGLSGFMPTRVLVGVSLVTIKEVLNKKNRHKDESN